MRKTKLAVFVHGWGVIKNRDQSRQWYRKNQRLIRLFEGQGYETMVLSMPGKYKLPDWDFEKYAHFLADELEKGYLCPHCEQKLPVEEIALIGHSMGGITCRLYLQEGGIGDPDTKSKVNMLITLASPHHGTSVGVQLNNSKCRDLLWPGSDFIRELNDADFPKDVDFHSIWSTGDGVMVPKHTSVSENASNYLIDNISVRHNGVMHRSNTEDIVRDILKGDPKPTGLQEYPDECNCNSKDKYWMPVGYRSEKPTGPKARNSMRKEYLFACKNMINNNECDETTDSLWWPNWWWGCEIGKNERLHTWRRTSYRGWRCRKCGDRKKGTNRPRNFDSSGICDRPFPRWHRYRIEWEKWECENCRTTTNRRWRPPIIGCEVGKAPDLNRRHDPIRVATRFIFKFKCSSCGDIRTIQEETPISYYR